MISEIGRRYAELERRPMEEKHVKLGKQNDSKASQDSKEALHEDTVEAAIAQGVEETVAAAVKGKTEIRATGARDESRQKVYRVRETHVIDRSSRITRRFCTNQ